MPTCKKLTQIPKDKLVEGRWYLGRGRDANVARWTRMKGEDRFTFLTIGKTFHLDDALVDESYYDSNEGFQPFLLLDEGYVLEPVGPCDKGWDVHYAKSLLLPSPPGDPKEWKAEPPRKPPCHHIWMQIRTEVCEGGTKKRYFHECPNCGRPKITTRRLVS